MRRFFISAMVVGLMVGSVAGAGAEGSIDSERTVKASYYGPQLYYGYFRSVMGFRNPVPAQEVRSCVESGPAGCVTLETNPSERALTARVTDASGQRASVWVVAAPASRTDLKSRKVYATFCGETTQPISFDPGTKLEFWIGSEWFPWWWIVPDLNCNPGPATSGTIHVTLS